MREHDQQCEGVKTAWKQLKLDFPKRLGHHLKDIWVEWRRERRGECDEHGNVSGM